jgi:hypothetical protein
MWRRNGNQAMQDRSGAIYDTPPVYITLCTQKLPRSFRAFDEVLYNRM